MGAAVADQPPMLGRCPDPSAIVKDKVVAGTFDHSLGQYLGRPPAPPQPWAGLLIEPEQDLPDEYILDRNPPKISGKDSRLAAQAELGGPFDARLVADQEPALAVLQPQRATVVVLKGPPPIDHPGRLPGDLVHLAPGRHVFGGIRAGRMVRNVDPPCMRFGFGVNWFRICHHNLPSLVVTNVTAGSRAKARRAASD